MTFFLSPLEKYVQARIGRNCWRVSAEIMVLRIKFMWVKHVPEKCVALELTNDVTSPNNPGFIFRRSNLNMYYFPSMATLVFRKLITWFGYVIGKFSPELLTFLFWIPDFPLVQNDFQNCWASASWTKERRRLSLFQRQGDVKAPSVAITSQLYWSVCLLLSYWDETWMVQLIKWPFIIFHAYFLFFSVLFSHFHFKKREGRTLVLFNLVTLVIWR